MIVVTINVELYKFDLRYFNVSFLTAHGHMLQNITGSDGSTILVAYLSFPNECEFVVMKMHDGGAGAVKFSQICQIFGPQVFLHLNLQILKIFKLLNNL